MRNILTTILLLAALTVAAQNYSPCYKEKYAEGVSLYNNGRYSEAKAKFVAAKGCPMPNAKEADTWIGKCNKAIEETEKARQELEAFESCKSVEACNRYLDRYPNGKYVTQVQQKKQELQAEDDAYKGCSSIEKCDEYLKNYPNGRYVSLATDMKINLLEEDNAYANCTTVEKCDEYLKKYPKGRYVAEVKRKRNVEQEKEESKRKAEEAAAAKRKEEIKALAQTYTVNGVLFTMKYVEGDTFTMGCAEQDGNHCFGDEKPPHKVLLSDYCIGETEVTQALWKAVMRKNKSKYKGENRPVESVSWNECQEFCDKLNNLMRNSLPSGYKFALPTEAQWEYAARGGKNHSPYKFSGSNTIEEVAWYQKNSYAKGFDSPDFGTHVVKTKKANNLGLYDMSGNVCEWCVDWYMNSYYEVSPSTNPKGPSAGSERVVRGGCWIRSDLPCWVYFRDSRAPDYSDSSCGFRLVIVRQ